MAINQFDTENADRDLTSQVTVLTDTPDASNNVMAIGLVYFGDGSKDLDGSGGNFELTITVGGQTIQPDPQIITFSTATRAAVWTTVFPVPANQEVIIKAKSPNSADSDVDVTAYLFEAMRGTDSAALASVCTEGRLAELDAANLPTDIAAIWTEAMSDLAAGAPSATASVLTAINYLYEAWRNKTVTNGTTDEVQIYKNDGATILCEADIDDDGTSFTRSKYGAED